jgi:hypothetical protein
MAFASGSMSYRRFAVNGKSPKTIAQDQLDALAAHALKEREFGAPDEVEYGWSGGRHLLDGQFSFEHNVFNDALHFALRVDTNKIPGDLKKAYQFMEEEAAAAANPSGFISKQQKKEAKEAVGRKLEDELRDGKYRRSKLVPMLWDVGGQTLYCNASGANFERLAEIFERTFGLDLEPLTTGSLALRLLEARGRRRDYEDLRPTRFVCGPDGESQFPEYPWVAKGPQPKDFLGNEFLLWLWHEADHRDGVFKTESAGEVTVYLDRALDLDCAYGQTGKDTLRGDGATRMPEARDAIRSGKLPRKAGIVLHAAGQQFELGLGAEALNASSAKFPEVEDADTPRTLFEERVTLLRDLSTGIDALFETFLKTRASSAWESHAATIRRWIMQYAKPIAAVA